VISHSPRYQQPPKNAKRGGLTTEDTEHTEKGAVGAKWKEERVQRKEEKRINHR